ncbi:MAG: hypothetical protein HGA87_02645 [Desulfobulbaceae bacterium]|nr:hypothetical protein [Desulfobulbaceae bacterium]
MICDKTTAEASSTIRDRKLSEVSIVKRDWLEIRLDDGSDYAILLKKIQGYPVKRIMKRYSEDCKPTTPGWYWAAYADGPEWLSSADDPVEPAYYSGSVWYAFDRQWREYQYGTPLFWCEMENCPTIPDGKA